MAGDLTLRITVTEIETLQKPWFCPGASPVLCSGWSPATGLPDPLARRPLPDLRRPGSGRLASGSGSPVAGEHPEQRTGDAPGQTLGRSGRGWSPAPDTQPDEAGTSP